jgi:hypothetical protein
MQTVDWGNYIGAYDSTRHDRYISSAVNTSQQYRHFSGLRFLI